MIMFASAFILALLSGGLTAMIGRAMFRSCAHHDQQHEGHTPGIFHVVDPRIAGLVENLYRAGRQEKRKEREHR